MALGPPACVGACGCALSRALSAERARRTSLQPASRRRWRRPNCCCRCAIGDYTDFYASIFHATNVGRAFRPDNPLLPNYKYVPVAYHGRASSVASAARRCGGRAGSASARTRRRRASARRAISITSSSSASMSARRQRARRAGPIGTARASICSASACSTTGRRATSRRWEYQPLGPFLGKNFATTVSPWVVTRGGAGAVPHRRVRAAAGDPRAAAVSRRCRRPARRRLRHHARGLSLRPRRCGEQGTAPLRLTQTSFATCTGRSRRWWRTTPATAATSARRSDRLRHGVGPGEIELGQPARTHRARQRADRTAERREARLPRGRRRDHLPRLLRQARLSAHRIRRMPSQSCCRRNRALRSNHSIGTHFCSRLPVSTSPV